MNSNATMPFVSPWITGSYITTEDHYRFEKIKTEMVTHQGTKVLSYQCQECQIVLMTKKKSGNTWQLNYYTKKPLIYQVMYNT